MQREEARFWNALFKRDLRSARRVALIVAVSFGVVGFVWVFATDVLVYALIKDPVLLARLQTAKDWTFVVLASVALYAVAYRAASSLARAHAVITAVVDSVGDGLLVLGPERTIVYANPAAIRMLECRDPSDVVGMGAERFSRRFLVSYPNGALVMPDAFISQRAFGDSGPLHYKAMMYPRLDNEVVMLVTAAAVRTRPDDEPALVVSVMHDITANENIERMRDHFFAAAAHSLKTPVAIIKANVQFMSRTAPQTARPSIRAIQRQCDRIDRLVQNLMIVARARSHSLRLYPREMELASIVQDVAHELSAVRGALDVRTDIVESPRIRGDRERLAIVVRNLSYDAVRAARPHTPLTLRLDRSGGDVELDVRYEPLDVAERTYAGNEEYDDSQLSRYATETIVEAHGGSTGEQEDDREATLWVRLPMMEDAA